MAFAWEVFAIRAWSRQVEILEAARDNDRVSVRSGHKVSKSNSAAILAFWFYLCFQGARVVLTAPTYRQVQHILWREMRGLWRRAAVKPCGPLPKHASTGIEEGGRQLVGYTSDQSESIAGISGPAVMYVLDEASGIEPETFEVIEGNRAGGDDTDDEVGIAKLVLFSNPTQQVGEFFDSHHSKSEFYRTIHISSEESPNNVEGRVVVPGLATRKWCREKRREWGGPGNPVWDVRVGGDFPAQSSAAVIGIALVEVAKRRWESLEVESSELHVGVDVAHFGDDDSAIAIRRGFHAKIAAAVTGYDTQAVAGKTIRVVKEHRRPGEHVFIKVDMGAMGPGVYDALVAANADELMGPHVHVIGLYMAGAPDEPEEYPMLRDELWFTARNWLRDGGALESSEPPTKDQGMLEADLKAPKYSPDAKGRLKVEPKKDTKKTLKRSPDRGDALCLAVYDGFQGVHDVEDQGAVEPLTRWEEGDGAY